MKRILVPTDFSIYAENALKAAAQLAKKNQAEIVLLHMLELPNQMSDAVSAGKSIPEVMFFIEKAKEKFTEIFDRPFLEGIQVTEYIQFEKAFDGVLKFVEKNNIDLIVMGSHGAAGMEEVFLGSNTEKIVRLSEVPVLVIKNEADQLEIKTIVFASDFSNEAKIPFSKLKTLAAKFDAEIKLVTICTPNSFKTTSEANFLMQSFVREFDLSNYSIALYNETNVEKGIMKYADEVDADLIALYTHGRTGFAHFFNGSITEDLANHSQKPVLSFKL